MRARKKLLKEQPFASILLTNFSKGKKQEQKWSDHMVEIFHNTFGCESFQSCNAKAFFDLPIYVFGLIDNFISAKLLKGLLPK